MLLLVLAIKLNVGYSSPGTQSQLLRYTRYSIFNTNSKVVARIIHLISERSLHRQLQRLRTAYRSQKTPPFLQPAPNVMWKRREDASWHHNALSALVCLTMFVLVFVQHGVSTHFTRGSPAELYIFLSWPDTWQSLLSLASCFFFVFSFPFLAWFSYSCYLVCAAVIYYIVDIVWYPGTVAKGCVVDVSRDGDTCEKVAWKARNASVL